MGIEEVIPPLVVKKHEGVFVVRDDLFPYGSKARFLGPLFSSIEESEVVYGSSPRWGLAQVSLAHVAREHGKKCTLFIAKARERTQYTERAERMGAVIVEVPMGFLAVCESRAKKHAYGNNGYLLPCGLDHPSVLSEIERVARGLGTIPDEVWTVAGSGVLTRGLQMAFPDAEFFAVQVGKSLSRESAGRATIIPSGMDFSKRTRELPPFPSIAEYDAKAWRFIPKDGKRVRLFWNVGV